MWVAEQYFIHQVAVVESQFSHPQILYFLDWGIAAGMGHLSSCGGHLSAGGCGASANVQFLHHDGILAADGPFLRFGFQ